MTTTKTDLSAADGRALLDRLDRLEPGRPHRRLMFQSGLGYTFDSFDGALMGYALSAVIVMWGVTESTACGCCPRSSSATSSARCWRAFWPTGSDAAA